MGISEGNRSRRGMTDKKCPAVGRKLQAQWREKSVVVGVSRAVIDKLLIGRCAKKQTVRTFLPSSRAQSDCSRPAPRAYQSGGFLDFHAIPQLDTVPTRARVSGQWHVIESAEPGQASGRLRYLFPCIFFQLSWTSPKRGLFVPWNAGRVSCVSRALAPRRGTCTSLKIRVAHFVPPAQQPI